MFDFCFLCLYMDKIIKKVLTKNLGRVYSPRIRGLFCVWW